ncbi:MAG: CDP-alcohol phosphatidyltransferase family protein [Bacteroidia bacterium]|nr:CDP-alcohol phosphatidyltransferase family protein [Bacteroidia bacterium]MBT8310077.1 CDP-alcohol phosphatidyltransferase family protein [Bacteroidia bacterium]NND11472.1 phosphatidylserine synthase [Flavobacteriaceae bacterium]NNK27670.1 phosphatidylserine synthase [Flavobacteriaceae bacterium]NNL59803.1 phosphatidylserine synthase [Flavobacteriaceae bacterium]
MKRFIPNFVTMLNLVSGSIAVLFAVNGNMTAAAFFVFLGIIFDFFDGLLARKLKVQSELGIQLDSLADMVTCGVVPGIVMFNLLLLATEHPVSSWSSYDLNTNSNWIGFNLPILPLFGFLITVASAYRLGKFNIDEDQQEYFRGLPVPANTLLILSLPLIMEFQNNDAMNTLILNKWFLIGLTLLSSYLLNSNIKLFALKFKTWGFKENATRYSFIILSIVSLIVLKFAAIPLIIPIYIIMSLLNNLSIKI